MTSYEKYRRLRDENKLKDVDISRRTGVSTSTLCCWAKMGTPGGYEPKIEKRKKIADYFGVPIGALIGD